ncbi:MAG TPA: SPOR domain-containing protein [Xanthomonadaceae bacterium]|nr:SPOR domain-containing protein [Xanthomonadaceae bacterium]
MDPALKHRLIGAAVLSALAIIFLPMLIVDRDKNSVAADVPLKVPSAPGGDFQTKELPLVAPAPGVPDGGVVGMDASHPAAPTAASPAVDANGQPLPAGVLPASASSTSAASPAITPPTVPVANPGAASPAAPTATAPAAAVPTSAAPVSAPATATPSAPIPAASAGGHYVVSLGTYSNAANAQSLVASLKGSQLPAYAEPVNVAGKMQTRVRIGPFAQRGDAEAARLKAQQVRTDMPASVTALDAATPAVDVPVMPAANKLTPAAMPAAVKPATTPTAAASKPVVSPVSTAAASSKTAPPATSAAAPAATKPSAPSPAASGRGYAVQVSAFRSEEEALTLRDKLRAAGFTAFSERIQAESGTLYRVRIGPEADRDAADRLRAELSTKMGMNGMVVGYP